MIFKALFNYSVVACLLVLLVGCGGAEERKASYMSKGKAFFEEGNFDKARIEFKNVLQIDPKFSLGYYYLGQIEEKNKDLGKAIANYNKAIELDPGYVDPKVNISKIYAIIGTEEYLDKSRNLLSEIFKTEPDHPEANLISASINFKTGDKDEALKKIEQLVHLHPDLQDGISLLSAIYLGKGMNDKAIDVLEKGVESNPQSIYLKMALSKLYAQKGEITEAESLLNSIIQKHPEKFSYRVALFSLFYSSSNIDKAESVLRQSIKDDEDDAQRYLMLAEFLAKTQSIKIAENELLKAIEKKPELIDLQYGIAELYKKTGRTEDSIAILENIRKERRSDKDIVKSTVAIANLYFDKKQYAKAIELIEEVRKDSPNDYDALLLKGRIDLAFGNAEEAVNDLRTVYKADPKNVEVTKYLATAHHMVGQDELAEGILQDAIQINPVDPENHINYAKYLLANQKIDEANKVVERAIAYFQSDYGLYELKLKLAGMKSDEDAILSTVREMKRLFPEQALPYLQQGQYYIYKKQYDLARTEFEKALEKGTDKYSPLDKIVGAFMAQDRAKDAISYLENLVDSGREIAIGNYLLGKVYFSSKQYGLAREYLNSAIKADSKWIEPYDLLAGSYLAEDNKEQAKKVYFDAIEQLPSSIPFRLKLANMFERDREIQKAKEQYKLILKDNPASLIAKNNLASLIVDGDPEKEELLYAQELVKNFDSLDNPAFLDTLGWVYHKSGQNEKAVQTLRKVVKKAPDVAIFNYHLGMALLNLEGGVEEGKKYLEQAVNSDQQFDGKDIARRAISS